MRLKIIAGNLIAVLLLGLGAYFYVSAELKTGLGAQLDTDIVKDELLLARSWRLSALEFTEQVRDRAASREVRSAFRALDLNSRRQRAHEQANSVAAWFQDPARGRGGRPDVVAITDETGRVIARDQDINRLNAESLAGSIPTIRNVLEGAAQHDAWFKEDENKLLQVSMAPIRNDEGGVIGALVVGYDISVGTAEREAEVLGREVAFVRGGAIYSSSLDQTILGGIEGQVGGSLADTVTAAQSGAASSPFTAEVGGNAWVGVVAPLPEVPSQQIAFMVLGNRTAAMGLAGVTTIILILMGVTALLVLGYGFWIGTTLLRPIEQIEEGVLSVINGQTDFRLDVQSAEMGGLAYRINQLINMFTGVAETDEEGHSTAPSAGWEGAAAMTAQPSEGGDDEGLAQELAAEPEADYLERIYTEYVAAKQAAGEDVSNIPKDRFIGRLQKNAESLTKKHGCKMVRFQVQTKGNQVILRPVIIR